MPARTVLVPPPGLLTEDLIGTGLNGPAWRAASRVLDSTPAAPRPASPGWPLDGLVRLPGRIADWLARRSVAPVSVTGISIALAICACAWFSAGTRTANLKGAVAAGACYLAVLAARQFTGLTERDGWLGALGGCCCECAVLAGLAAGAAAQGWAGMWSLALAVLALTAIRGTMTTCADAGEGDGPVRRVVDTVLAMPAGGRVLLIVAVAPLWGARAALLALLDWAIIAVGFGIGSGTIWRRDRELDPVAAEVTEPEPASLAVLLRPAGPDPAAPDLADLSPAEPDAVAEAAWRQYRLAVVLRCRDDGAVSRWLGRLAHGQLMPLPPALLALAAVAVLAHLGMDNLPGLLILAPALVMLLAGPGSSHPHGGRLDWLAPVVPVGAQFLYLAALGSAARLPAGVTFALCAAIAVHYADLCCAGSPGPADVPPSAQPAGPVRALLASGTWLGWDGRMLACGLGAAMGVTLFAYLALAAYLGVLICWKVLTSYVALREGDCR